jgi:TM2 domain-containing membrane protein YozV
MSDFFCFCLPFLGFDFMLFGCTPHCCAKAYIGQIVHRHLFGLGIFVVSHAIGYLGVENFQQQRIEKLYNIFIIGISMGRLYSKFEEALELRVLFHFAKQVLDCILAILFQQAFVELLANPVSKNG